jgi:hypothetical protein
MQSAGSKEKEGEEKKGKKRAEYYVWHSRHKVLKRILCNTAIYSPSSKLSRIIPPPPFDHPSLPHSH